jgi:hypothetical protein
MELKVFDYNGYRILEEEITLADVLRNENHIPTEYRQIGVPKWTSIFKVSMKHTYSRTESHAWCIIAGMTKGRLMGVSWTVHVCFEPKIEPGLLREIVREEQDL